MRRIICYLFVYYHYSKHFFQYSDIPYNDILPIVFHLVKVSDWYLFRTNPIYSEIYMRANPNWSEKSFQSRLMQIGKKSIWLNPS